MNVSDLLNPVTSTKEEHMIGKPRSRFSEYEDNIIRQGVANRLTWGQISDLLPHRKRATCFNRYRTLQGIRKSRKSPSPVASYYPTSPNSMYHHDALFYHHHHNQQQQQQSSPTSSYASSDSSSDENDDYIIRHSLPSIKPPYIHSSM